MRSTKRSSGSGLFLIELIIAIGFFSVTSAICVQLFAKAHTLSMASSDLSMAVVAAQSAAEGFKGAVYSAEQWSALDGETAVTGYDADWQRTEEENDLRYRVETHYDTSSSPYCTEIVVFRQRGEEIYRLTAKRYVAP